MTPTTEFADRIHDPIHRTTYTFQRDGADLWVETWFEDRAHLPEHFHPTLEEHWEMVHGTVQLKLDGRWRELTPADGPLVVTPNVRHELKNTSGREAHGRTKVIPAGRLEEFLTESAQAAREGLINAHNMPTSLRAGLWMAAFAQRFRDETVVTSPPPALQRIVLPFLSRLAR
jgi:mannose-6-phosphate isomerase-like protein (cupin superfamily)